MKRLIDTLFFLCLLPFRQPLIIGMPLLMTACVAAEAGTIATASNNGGGEIMLTDDACAINNQYRRVVSTTSNGTVLEGCWAINEEDYITVTWTHTNGQRRENSIRVYPLGGFTATPLGVEYGRRYDRGERRRY